MRFQTLTDLAEILMDPSLTGKYGKKPVSKPKPPAAPAPGQQDNTAAQPAETPEAANIVTSARPAAAGPAVDRPNMPASFELNESNILQAVIFSEFLGEPLCKRKRRWRNWS